MAGLPPPRLPAGNPAGRFSLRARRASLSDACGLPRLRDKRPELVGRQYAAQLRMNIVAKPGAIGRVMTAGIGPPVQLSVGECHLAGVLHRFPVGQGNVADHFPGNPQVGAGAENTAGIPLPDHENETAMGDPGGLRCGWRLAERNEFMARRTGVGQIQHQFQQGGGHGVTAGKSLVDIGFGGVQRATEVVEKFRVGVQASHDGS